MVFLLESSGLTFRGSWNQDPNPNSEIQKPDSSLRPSRTENSSLGARHLGDFPRSQGIPSVCLPEQTAASENKSSKHLFTEASSGKPQILSVASGSIRFWSGDLEEWSDELQYPPTQGKRSQSLIWLLREARVIHSFSDSPCDLVDTLVRETRSPVREALQLIAHW